MKGKRGLSPLIATVLLIGFAVALGVMIMSITQPLVTGPCSDVNVKPEMFCKEGPKLFAVKSGETAKCDKTNFLDTGEIKVCTA